MCWGGGVLSLGASFVVADMGGGILSTPREAVDSLVAEFTRDTDTLRVRENESDAVVEVEGWVRRVVLVDLHASIALETLEPELSRAERALAENLPDRRRRTYVGGRVALRRALAALGEADVRDIGADDRGAPILPSELSGSIAHKDEVAVAYAEPRTRGGRVGVDVELGRQLSEGVVRRVLCDDELTELESRGAEARSRAALERFAAKEAIYKAIDPFLRRYVGFREVRLRDAEPGLWFAEGAAIDGLAVVARVERVSGPRGQGLVLALAHARAR